MATGLIIMPIGGDDKRRLNLFNELKKKIDIWYVSDEDASLLQGDDSLKADTIISTLKNYMALSKPYIFFNCENKTLQQRRVILEYASKANYGVVGLVLDTPTLVNTMDKDAPNMSEYFQNIYYKD